MTLLYTDPCFLEHDTGRHPECAERLRQITAHLEAAGLPEKCVRPAWDAVSPARLAAVHAPEYSEQVAAFAKRGGGQIERDTIVSRRSYDVALRAAGAVCDAVERVVAGEDRSALCLSRPPGHHALHAGAMGFCLFNHVAVAARMATRELGLDRVLIVDWDVHHGNATQDTFWEDPQVSFLSIHRWPFYPGTGRADETGEGPGLRGILNLPVEFGTPRREYLALLTRELEAFADRIQPQLVLLSAGFDAHAADPVGSLGLETEDFVPLTSIVRDVAAAHAEGRLVSVLEGGYHPPVLAECVGLHLAELLK